MKSPNTNHRLTILIRMIREFDTKKNDKDQVKYFLEFIAHDLELILGGFYE